MLPLWFSGAAVSLMSWLQWKSLKSLELTETHRILLESVELTGVTVSPWSSLE